MSSLISSKYKKDSVVHLNSYRGFFTSNENISQVARRMYYMYRQNHGQLSYEKYLPLVARRMLSWKVKRPLLYPDITIALDYLNQDFIDRNRDMYLIEKPGPVHQTNNVFKSVVLTDKGVYKKNKDLLHEDLHGLSFPKIRNIHIDYNDMRYKNDIPHWRIAPHARNTELGDGLGTTVDNSSLETPLSSNNSRVFHEFKF
jgi:hypothetical protein